ncbi:MAG: hypothetical protein UY76_C0028G0020 [Candidatus Uhrbacteria bacterium GW2011_GWA2_52_8d]|uniref:Uncharacterized protein n=1 Tax=Candidatus Uhrbacteria bacterium GW2011_GWA2_52_8d TaxID=1618979 RepID=A0A0G2AIL9_9BACT|nr:MAG: hypothetical protein UY76_C0028G0020 [Candidatus Uhrbacteria bacterium GW2011_GWA2_52_8d]
MNVLPLFTIPAIFLVVVLAKPFIVRKTMWNICSACAAVSLTWVALLILLWLGIIHDPLPIAILMGMSVTGLMYKLAGYYQKHGLRHVWAARLAILIGGFMVVLLLLQGNGRGVFLSGVGSLLVVAIISSLMQKTTHKQAVESSGQGVKKSLLKKLDNCC